MKPNFEQLTGIQKVNPPEDLFEKICLRIQHKKELLVNPFYTKFAAAFFAVLFTAEIYLINYTNHENSIDLEVIVPQTNNILYD